MKLYIKFKALTAIAIVAIICLQPYEGIASSSKGQTIIRHCINTKWDDFSDKQYYHLMATRILGAEIHKTYKAETDNITMEVDVLDGMIVRQSSTFVLGVAADQTFTEMDAFIRSANPKEMHKGTAQERTYFFKDVVIALVKQIDDRIVYTISALSYQQMQDASLQGTEGLQGINPSNPEVDPVLEELRALSSRSAADYNRYINYVNYNTPVQQEVGKVGINDSRYDREITSVTQLDDLNNTRVELQGKHSVDAIILCVLCMLGMVFLIVYICKKQ